VWSGEDRHRPALDDLLDRLVPGDTVLAYALDRLSRSQVDTAIIIDRIEGAGASLALVTEDFERSATGTFLRNAKAFVAELEREKIKERTGRGRRERAVSGKLLPGAYPPFGLQWADAAKTRLVLDPDTGPVVRTIFTLALEGLSLRAIAAQLERRGIASPAGNARWSASSVRHILTRPVYTGSQVAFRERLTRRPGGGHIRRAGTSEEQIIVPNVAPELVSAEEMAAVAARLATNKQASTRNNRCPEATLLRNGHIFCGHCGWTLTAQNSPPHNPTRSAVYRCRSRTMKVHDCPQPGIAASVIDGPVWERIREVLSHPEIIAAEVQQHRQRGGLERDLAIVEKVLATVMSKQRRITQAIAALDDDDAMTPLLAELTTLAARKSAAETERDALQQRIADEAADVERVRNLTEWCQTVSVNLDTLSYDEKRLALDALGVRVEVWRLSTRNEAGNENPRWAMMMSPHAVMPPDDILYQTSRYLPAAPLAILAARRR
jgi:site-specific DNA recombinase